MTGNPSGPDAFPSVSAVDAAQLDTALTQAAQRAAAELDRIRGTEALGVAMRETAHQFNNLLTVLQSSVELLGMANLPEERRGRYLHAIQDATDRAGKLVGDLQALARSAAPKRLTFDVAGRLAGLVKGPAGLSVSVDAAGFDAAIATLTAMLRPSSTQPRPDIRLALSDGSSAGHDLPAGEGPHVMITLSGSTSDSAFTNRFLDGLEAAELAHGWLELFSFLARSSGTLRVQTSNDGAPVFVLALPAA